MLKRIFLCAGLVIASLYMFVSTATSTVVVNNHWTLTNEERRDFLYFYAPIILKRGNSNNGDHGRDFITNWDFDRDWVFSDNSRDWKDIGVYIDDAIAGKTTPRRAWQIRPTLYTSMLEYMDGKQKNLTLFYHVYHGMDNNAAGTRQLHDWERIEIHIKNISKTGKPNAGEAIDFAVITQHHRSVRRHYNSGDFNTLSTNTGNHLLIWQAEWSDKLTGPHGQELRYIQDSWHTISSDMSNNRVAEVEINGTSKDKNVHYAFIPEKAADAVSNFRAGKLRWDNMQHMTSRYDNGDEARWSGVPRVKYELQDIADIVPTHWSKGNYQPHWTTENSERIRMVTPIKTREGVSITGLETFYTRSNDVQNSDGRSGYLSKGWFWGVYEIREVCDIGTETNIACINNTAEQFHNNSFASTKIDDRGRTRASANRIAQSAGNYWFQHDYFVHSGTKDNTHGIEGGYWLPRFWHLQSRGGYDGRWDKLFDDRLDEDPTFPMVLTVSGATSGCLEFSTFTSKVYGGKGPYTHRWYRSGSLISTTVGSQAVLRMADANTLYTVTVTDAEGSRVSRNAYYNMNCSGGILPRQIR